MPVWLTAPVDAVPRMVLVRWMLIRTELGDVHAVGYSQEHREGRVSSPVVRFDAAEQLATTRSGRIYMLHGAAGRDADALYVFDVWRRLNGVAAWVDVTHELLDRGDPNQAGKRFTSRGTP